MSLTRDLLHQLSDPRLSNDQRITLKCRVAKELSESGNYQAACEALGDQWQGLGEPPLLDDLSKQGKAEVLIAVGVLTGWIGSTQQVHGTQEFAKNLLSEGITIYESLQQLDRAAEARTELAYCYWREGAFDEARIFLRESLNGLQDVEDDRKLIALLRSVIVEESARRYHDALKIHIDAAPLFQKSPNSVLKGKFHHLFGFVLRKLSEVELRRDYIDQALIEYAAASYYFDEAGLTRHRACVENNLGFLFGTIERYSNAHEHLDLAQMLFTSLKDSVHLAQVDETRARVMLAEGRLVEAEKTVRAAVRTLEKGDEQSLLAEALTTHGIAQARLRHRDQARTTLQRALEVAERAGDLDSAGNAALVIVEELISYVPNDELKLTVDRASELLANSQDLSALKRLANCSSRVLTQVHASPRFPGKVDWANFSFRQTLLEYEAHFINLALEDSGGIVSKAARLLGFNHHQSLLSMLNGRHEILRHRSTPILPRRRSIIPNTENGSSAGKRRRKRSIKILMVEDDPAITRLLQENVDSIGAEIAEITDGTTAMEVMASGAHYDLLVLRNEIPGVSGQQLARLARSLAHYRKTPIIVLATNDLDDQMQLDDSNFYLLKADELNTVTETINRLFQSPGQ